MLSAPPMAPLGVAIVAAEALAAGKDRAGVAAAVRAAVSADPSIAEGSPFRKGQPGPTRPGPAQEPEAPEVTDEELAAHFQRKYLLAYLRLSQGRFEGLSNEELYEAAQCSTVQTVDFETWARRMKIKD